MASISSFSDTSEHVAFPWPRRHSDVVQWRRYYTGDVFRDLAPPPPDGSKPPLKYPLQVNFIKIICQLHAATLLGQFRPERVVQVRWAPKRKGYGERTDEDKAKRATERLIEIFDSSPLERVLLPGAVDQQVAGGFWVQVRKRAKKTPALVGRSYEHIFAITDPDDPQRVLRLTMAYQIPVDAAVELTGQKPTSAGVMQTVEYREEWTLDRVNIFVESKFVPHLSGPHGFKDEDGETGLIPFVYFPRVVGDFYDASGESLIPGLIGLQNELNLRLADMGDAINYGAHPIIWVRNYKGNVRDLPFGPDSIWNLGQQIGASPPPEAGVLEKHIDPAVFEYAAIVRDILQTVGSSSDVDWGKDEGSQRSDATLQTRREPSARPNRMSRVWLNLGLRRLSTVALLVSNQSGLGAVAVPDWAPEIKLPPLLPRERTAILDEINILWGVNNGPLISEERIMDVLDPDDPEEELELIRKLREEFAKKEEKLQEQKMVMEQEKHEQQLGFNEEKHKQGLQMTKASADQKSKIQAEQSKRKPADAKARPQAGTQKKAS